MSLFAIVLLPQPLSNQPGRGRGGEPSSNEKRHQLPALSGVSQTLAVTSKAPIQHLLEKRVLAAFLVEAFDHFAGEVTIDLHRDETSHHTPWPVTAHGGFEPRNRRGGAPIVDDAFLDER